MKIAYIIDIKKDDKSIGVLNKVDAQIKEWRKLGHTVHPIYLFDFYPGLDKKLTFLPKKVSTFIELCVNSLPLKSHIKNNHFDIIYSRALLFTPFISFLRKHNFIMELNANELDEYKKTSGLLYCYSKLTRSLVYSLPKGFVAVSREIAKYYSSFGKETLVIANACPDLNFPLKTNQVNKSPIIGFIGSNKYIWNGSEKVLTLAGRFPGYNFEFIGFHLEGAASNVRTFGFLKEAESIEIMKRWDAAFSTLSLYEQNLSEASPLKSRLYIAMNIPFIYAYDDTDEPFSNCLKISNTPSNLESHFEEIKSFFQKTFESHPSKIEHNCSLNLKESQRLSFMTEILSRKR